ADLIADPRFRTNDDRLKNVEALDGIIGDFIATHTQTDLVTLMEAASVTVGPIYDIAQILQDPHVIDREILADYPDPEVGSLPMHHVVPRL
ncbi:CoA transferase, partial [Xanthomonas citri pv. citri]|nr:CoA transferase [Xanthomonas citri pv. citri]